LVFFTLFSFSCSFLSDLDSSNNDSATDSDGDGYSNDAETTTFLFNPDNNPLKFNPYIADLPQLELQLSSLPYISLTATKSGESTQTFETAWSTADENSFTTSNTTSTATTVGHTAGVTLAAEHEFGFFGGTTISGELRYDYSHTQETSNSFTSELSATRTSTYEEAQSYSTTNGYTLSGGTLKIYLTIRNTGDISYTVKSLGLSAVRFHPYAEGNQIIPAANLTYDGDSFPETTLAPGGTMVAVYSATVDLSTAEKLLQNSNNISINISNYEIVDENDKAFAHNMTNVEARTFSLLIDYGVRSLNKPERYKISPDFSTESLVSLDDVFNDVLSMPYEEGEMSVNGGTVTGISSIRNLASSTTGNPGYWMLYHTYSNSGIYETSIYSPAESYSISDIEINRGDKILLLYVEDRDHDGLLAREEFAYGCSDLLIDSDGDGTSDKNEVEAGTNPAIDENDTTPPPTPQSLGEVSSAAVSLKSSNRANAILTWTNPNSTTNTLFNNVIIVRGEGEEVTVRPTAGQSYSTGGFISDQKFKIVYIGNASSFEDSNMEYGKTYHYRIFASDITGNGGTGTVYSTGKTCSVKTDIQVTVNLTEITVEDEGDGNGACELYWTIKVTTSTGGSHTLDYKPSSSHWSTYEASYTDTNTNIFSPGTANFTIPQEDSAWFKVDIDIKEYDGSDPDDMVIDEVFTYKVYDTYITSTTGTFPNITFNYGDRYWYDSDVGWSNKSCSDYSGSSEDTILTVYYTIQASS
jgi:hypothetical protein